MKPGGMHFAASRSFGISAGHGTAPSAASVRILVPEIEMKSSARAFSLGFIVWSRLS